MRIVSVTITNFRSIEGPLAVKLRSPHAVLVGPNNAGKSNILVALEWLLRRRAYNLRPHPDDYFNPGHEIKIEATLGDVSEDDKKSLYSLCTTKPQKGALSSKDDPHITISLTVAPLRLDLPRQSSDDDTPDTDAIESGKAHLEISLWGFAVRRRVEEARARLIYFLLVSPVRRVDDELSASRWTLYGELMKSLLEQSPQFPDLQQQLAEVTATINTAFSEQKGQLIADARIVTYVDDLAFQLTKNNDPVELLRNLQIMITEGPRTMSLERLGTGTQSAVIIGMMELVLRAGRGDAKFFAIEEPDAFIHPHGVRHLASLMRRNASEGSSQVMLSTHSPSLLATMRPGEIVRVEKRKGRTEAFQAKGELADSFFGRYVNQNTAEIFFARRAVLVEGATERFLLPPLSPLVQRKGRDLDFGRSCISVVDIGGKSSVTAYLKLLYEFEIEAFAILDNDFLGDRSCSTTVQYLRGRGAEIDDSTPDALRRDLAKLNIIVLSKGEIEDYVPEPDVVAASEQDAATVHQLLAGHSKTSDAFKAVFRMGKPQYAQVLADLYVSRRAIPSDMERLIAKIGS
jgi:predicted ATP-dependent endonuclease of OLD family